MTWQERVILWGNRLFVVIGVLLAVHIIYSGERFVPGYSTLENYNEQR